MGNATPPFHLGQAFIRRLILSALLIPLIVSHSSAVTNDSTEFEEFGRYMVETLGAGDGKAFSEALDKETIVESVFEGVSQDTKTANDLRKGLSLGLDRAGQLIATNFENARLTFLKSRFKDNAFHALIRIDFGDAGLNYLELVLHKDAAGAIKITDWYDYAKGQLYTDSIRQAFILLLPEEESLTQKLLRIDALDKKDAQRFSELARLLREQKYSDWLEMYDRLSPELKHSRILLLTRVQVASVLGDEGQYRLSLKEVHDRLGDDPTLSLLLLDHYFYENDFEAAHKALDNLSAYIGGDAAIEALRANIYLTSKNYSEARKQAQKAIEQDAQYEDAYWTLLTASVLEGQYDISVKALEMLEDRFGYEFDPEAFAKEEAYAEFVKSDAYSKWKDK